MRVNEAMTRDVRIANPEQSIRDVAEIMADCDVGSLPVGENDRLVGMITDRDIIVRATAEGRDPKTTLVKAAMTPGVVYVYEDQDIEEAAALMKERQIRRLVVLDRTKRLVGILSLGDIAEEADEVTSGEVLERVSEPSRHARASRRDS